MFLTTWIAWSLAAALAGTDVAAIHGRAWVNNVPTSNLNVYVTNKDLTHLYARAVSTEGPLGPDFGRFVVGGLPAKTDLYVWVVPQAGPKLLGFRQVTLAPNS